MRTTSTEAVAPVGRAAPRRSWSSVPEAARFLALLLLVVALFHPYLVQRVLPVPLTMFAALMLYAVAELQLCRSNGAVMGVWIAVGGAALGGVLAVTSLLPTFSVEGRRTIAIVLAYGFVLPAAAAAGVLLARDARRRQLVGMVGWIAATAGAMALVERVLRRQLFPWNDLDARSPRANALDVLGGAWRGIVLAEHPLVLAGLLAASIPLVLALRRPVARVFAVLLVLAGIWGTDSSGPLAVGVAVVLVWAWRRLRSRRGGGRPLHASGRVALDVVVATTMTAFLAASWWVWRPLIDPAAALDASTQYRFALWSLMPRIIEQAPLGFGLGGTPEGRFLIDSTPRNIDIAVTVDSEVVLLVIQFGVVGLVLFLAVLWVLARLVVRREDALVTVAPALVLTLVGFFLAIHVWNSLGAFWVLLTAMALATRPIGTASDHRAPPGLGNADSR